MKNKKLYLIFALILFIFSIASKEYCVSASNILKEDATQHNLYIENENFKVIYTGENSNIMPINSLKILDKKTNKTIDNEIWSSAILLENGNFILGKFNNGKYSYYEMNKQGEKNFLIDLNYYIKEMDKETGNYIIIEKDSESNKYKLGILDKEFNILFKPIFEYKKVDFKNGVEILKILNGKYGLYSSLGKEIIQPIFDSLKFNDSSKILVTAQLNNKTYTLERVAKGYKNITTIKTLDEWAKQPILNTINLGLVSHNLQLKFKENITREEFCQLIINLYEIKTEIEIDISKYENPFLDTNSEYILKAHKLNLISGKAKNIFEPKSFITREEAAVIIANLIKAMGISPKEKNIKNYSDKDLISDWAYSSVMIVSSENIMQGNNNFFKPKDNIKVQEALAIIDRIY